MTMVVASSSFRKNQALIKGHLFGRQCALLTIGCVKYVSSLVKPMFCLQQSRELARILGVSPQSSARPM